MVLWIQVEFADIHDGLGIVVREKLEPPMIPKIVGPLYATGGQI